ncbi:Cytochrome P450 [Macrophomina phaseolina MS6]|uniref:Cytochrome P450 n=1 Tax=Macrophomina phaseolina (strain MS6) TaxID=1126212 RepID=K2RD48_MACPH|nr:Cytochrome P450 [Macrophomina phaseolina MS6]
MTFFLLQHPEAYRRLVEEVRTTFETEEDLADAARLPTLKWVDACIKEAQRLHSPLPTPLPRYIPAGGADICGQFVPEGSCVVVTTDAAYRSKDNFHDPLSFRPERWLDERDPVFENDKREVFQPFLLGPKSCIGKPMALLQMRWIAATIFWKYDLELREESRNWIDQRVFVLWEQKPLLVNLKLRDS